jgi:8-oxo-dGTP diphosphatase
VTFSYPYPRPALSVDCVVFGLEGESVEVLLIERRDPPHAGAWALPGGFVEEGETVEQAAARELAEETGLADVDLQQLHTFSAPDRDPRGWVVTVAHLGVVRRADHEVRAADDARSARWVPLDQARHLAFDHDEILRLALQRLLASGLGVKV